MKLHIRLATLILLAIYLTIPATLLLSYGIRQPIPQLRLQIPAHEFNGTSAYELLVNLTRDYPQRIVGTAQGNESASWVASWFQGLGLNTTVQSFPTIDFQGKRINGTNVYAVSPGDSEQALIILAHRDVHPQTSQGADDNGSGTVALMELARVLTSSRHNLTYYFLSTDSEEINLGGSAFFAEHVARHLTVTLALSLDEIGYKEERSLLIYAYSHQANFADAGTLLTASSIGQKLGLPTYPEIPDQIARRAGVNLFSSDSASFLVSGIQSYSLGDPTYQYAHTASDTIDQVSASRLEAVGRWVETLTFNLDEGLEMPTLGETYLIYADGYTPISGIELHLATYLVVAFAVPVSLFIRQRPGKSDLLASGGPIIAAFLILLAATLLPLLYRIAGLWPTQAGEIRLLLIGVYIVEVLAAAAFLLLSPTKIFKHFRIPAQPSALIDRRIWIAGLLSVTFLSNFAFHPYPAILFFALPTLLPQIVSMRGRGGSPLSILTALLAPFPLYAAALAGALIFGLQGVLEYLVGQISAGFLFFELAAIVAIAISTVHTLRGFLSTA